MKRLSQSFFILAMLAVHVATSVTASPLRSFTVGGTKDGVVFKTMSTRPGLLRLRVKAGEKQLTALYHFIAGQNSHLVSLAGTSAHQLRNGVLYFEAEFRFRRYLFERFVGGTGKGQGRFNRPVAITHGTHDHLLVVDQGNDRVQVFDRDYRYLFEFGGFAWNKARSGNEELDSRFDQPTDVAESANREIFVTDRGNNRLVRFDLQGRFLGIVGSDEGLRLPRGVAANRLGHIVVCDTDNDRILRFDNTGRLDLEFGSFGRSRRQFNNPIAASFDPAGNLYVVDRGNKRLQVFDATMRPAYDIRLEGVQPCGVFIDQEHFLYLVDENSPRILVLNNAFQAIEQLPGPRDAYALSKPVDVTVSADGRLHVVDSGKNAVAVIRIEQELLLRRGKVKVATSN